MCIRCIVAVDLCVSEHLPLSALFFRKITEQVAQVFRKLMQN
jgi:hypothetical protein